MNSKDDSHLFRQAMTGVNCNRRQYREERHLPQEAALKPPIKIRQADSTALPPSAGVMIDKTDQGDYVEFCRGGPQHKRFKKLKSGCCGFEAVLDLHGCTTIEAERALQDFLTEARNARAITLLIIHGKGLRSGPLGGVLKPLTLEWLKGQHQVKAFCSALPQDGGTGAVYVLL